MDIDSEIDIEIDLDNPNPKPKIVIYTNEEKNKQIVNILCKAIAKSIYESKFKYKLMESCN